MPGPAPIIKRVQLKEEKWKRIKKEILKLSGAFTAIGLFSEDKTEDGINLATIGAINEFGSRDGRIPERSWMRAWVDKNRRKIEAKKKELYGMILDGRINADRALKLLGEFAQGGMKEFMTALNYPPNAPATIIAKGSSNPLIDTARTRNSIRHKEFYKRGLLK